MLKDPTDLTKRKPRTIGGTPSNKVVWILGASIASTFYAIAIWYGTTEIEWVKRRREASAKAAEPTEEDILRHQILLDPFLGSVINMLQEKIEKKTADESVPKVPNIDKATTEQ